jgi:hypothetical protein
MSSEAVQILYRGLPHIPFASDSVDLIHFRPVGRRIGYATRNTSSEPEVGSGGDSLF